MITDEQIKRFSELFKGYDKHFGCYIPKTQTAAGEKVEGRAWTESGKITENDFKIHLQGSGRGVGIIMLQGNDTCRFCVLDVDDYSITMESLNAKVRLYNLPLVLCRSKSGGTHLYLFLIEDVPAVLLREKLEQWRSMLGLAVTTEVFPKQVSRASDRDKGNWINIPYFNAEDTMRYAIDRDDNPLDLGQFLKFAEESAITLLELESVEWGKKKPGELFFEGPPCLITIHTQKGFVVGTRDDGMVQVATYLKKRFGDRWEEHMDEYNREMANLPSADITRMVKSMRNKTYKYACKRAPIKDYCARNQCLKREYGVGEHGADSIKFEITSVVRYDHPAPDPPMWSFEISGRRVMVDNETFISKDRLNQAILSQANMVPILCSTREWLIHLNKLLQEAEVVPMPAEVGASGQLWERVQMFLDWGVPARTKDEILTGKIWHHDGRANFMGRDLYDYFKSRHIQIKSEGSMWQILVGKGAVSKSTRFSNGRILNVWSIPFEKAPRIQEVSEHEDIDAF